MFQIEKYKTESGECPLDNFIKELINSGQRQDVTKINYYINLLMNFGEEILSNSTWAKNLGNGIYELRPKSNRVLYFYCSSNEVYILLHGFKKKQQQTPQSEIEQAKREINDYERRHSKNGK